MVAFSALAAWGWRRWPDPLIDFGRELYVAGQLLEGRLLYRDVASLFRPLILGRGLASASTAPTGMRFPQGKATAWAGGPAPASCGGNLATRHVHP